MQLSRVSRRPYDLGVRVLALALVAAAGIAVGRWLMPAGDVVSSTSLEAGDLRFAIPSEPVAPDASAGLMIGVSIPPVAPLGMGTVDGMVAPDSTAEGHVIGITFKPVAGGDSGVVNEVVAPESSADGHVIGVRFR